MQSHKERLALGQRGEREAEQFLLAHGYQVLGRNYRSRYGEVDLIVLDGQTIVFVEVRTQSGNRFGGPLESVNWRKQRQVAKAALHYMTTRHLLHHVARFDVIGIHWAENNKLGKIVHVKDAFVLS